MIFLQPIGKGPSTIAHYAPFIIMACPARFERATYGFEGRCSIQLSYRQIYLLILTDLPTTLIVTF